MTKRYVAMRVWLTKRAETSGEEGQGSIEYLGALLVAAALVALALAAVNGIDITQKVKDAADKVFQ